MRIARLPMRCWPTKHILLLMVVGALLLAGCSRGSDDGAPTSTANPLPTATLAPPLRIVTPAPVVPGASADPANPAGSERPEIYVVQDNDTLYGIAVRFNVTLEELIRLNGLSNPNDIYAGQELQIPPLP